MIYWLNGETIKWKEMLAHITWMEYILGISLILAAYYSYVFYKYYIPDFKKKEAALLREQYDQSYEDDFDTDSVPDELFDQAQELLAKVKRIIIDAASKHLAKGDLLIAIKRQLGDYPSLNTEEFRPGITSMIIIECDNNSSVTLSESEVDGLW